MNLLNSPLIWGACAFAIPLILHILNRSRFQRVEWGAMHLLESVVKVNHKRFRIEQLILLLVRCAIPILLALCLARPVLTGSQTLTGNAPVSMVVLLDNSYSMDAIDGTGTRFDQAINAAKSIIDETGKGSEITVVQTGGGPNPIFDQPVFDSSAVSRRLTTLKSGYGASEMADSLKFGLSTLAEMSHPRRELIVISDFQSTDWNDQASLADSIRRQAKAMSFEPAVTLLPVGKPVSGNLSVDSLIFSKRPLGVGQRLSVRAVLKNHDDSAAAARIVLKIDGEDTATSQVELTGSGESQALFPCEFETPGSHVIEVSIKANDSLKTDNTISAAVTVWDQINVLLVDGDPSNEPLRSETDFLSVALTPYSFGRLKLADLVQTTSVDQNKFKLENLEQFKVIVLANTRRLKTDQLQAIRKYVRNGGALIVTAGDNTDVKWSNQYLAEGGFLAATYGAKRGQPGGNSSRIVSRRFDHPALQFFNEAANGDLSTSEIRRWFELQPAQSIGSEDDIPAEEQIGDPLVMATLDSGEPVLIERSVGKGVVVQFATTCDADWTDLPMRPFFVPLMQQLVTTMATRLNPPRNIETGEAAIALFENRAELAETSLSLTTPEGSRRTIKAVPQGDNLLAKFSATRRPGVYTMTTPEEQSLHFVASTSRDESQLQSLSPDKLKTLSNDLSATLVSSASEYLEQDRTRRHGTEIWKYVLIALLIFLFLEIVLQQQFARVTV